MGFIFLLTLFPVILNPLQISYLVLGQFLQLFIVFGRVGEEFGEELLENLEVVCVFSLFNRFNVLLILYVGTIDILSRNSYLTEFRFAIVLSFDVGIERGITEIGLTAVAGKITAVLVISSPSLSLLLTALIGVVFVAPRPKVGLTHSRLINIIQNSNRVKMLAFVGLKVLKPITDRQKYKAALQEIKHYLSFKSKVQVEQSEYVLEIINGQYVFSLVKNPLFLHTNYYNMPIQQKEDVQFLDICYESLMIIREAFPASTRLEVITDSETKEMDAFQERKEEEYNRRINSHLKTILDSKADLNNDDVEDIIYLILKHYSRKNKIIAAKLLLNRVTLQNVYDIPDEYLEYLQKLQQEADMKKLVGQLINKIRALQQESSKNNENQMSLSNVSMNKYGESLKLQPVIFQLKQSYNLQRICALLSNILSTQIDKDYLSKIESSIVLVTNRFIANQYEEASLYSLEFADLLKNYWLKRCKKWEESSRTAVENKARELNSSRVVTSKSKMQTSRKVYIH